MSTIQQVRYPEIVDPCISREATFARWIPAVVAGVICVCAVLLAANSSIHWDEAWSWETARKSSWLQLILYEPKAWANNHLLNSLYLKVADSVFGRNLFAFRIVSLISLLGTCIYFVRSFRETPFLALSLMVTWLSFPIVWYHFILARGYALAMLATLLSLHYLKAFASTVAFRDKAMAIMLAAVAAASLMSYSFFLLSVTLVCTVIELTQMRRAISLRSLTRFFPEVVGGLFCFAYLIPIGRKICLTDMFIPGSNSLIQVFNSALSCHVGTQTLSIHGTIIAKALVLMGLFGLAVAILTTVRQQSISRSIPPKAVAAICVLLMIANWCVSHFILGTAFPLGRGAFPLYLCAFVAASEGIAIAWQGRSKTFCFACLALISVTAIPENCRIFLTLVNPSDAATAASLILADEGVASTSEQASTRVVTIDPGLCFYLPDASFAVTFYDSGPFPDSCWARYAFGPEWALIAFQSNQNCDFSRVATSHLKEYFLLKNE